MPIYTKKGDKGETSMFAVPLGMPSRVSKDSTRIHTIGAIDELNSYLGIVGFFTKSKKSKKMLLEIQKNLFTTCSMLSGAKLSLPVNATQKLEKYIDETDKKLPALKNFLISKGSLGAVHAMYARALARRAERRVVALSKKEEVNAEILVYINRLSDQLFMVFRYENLLEGEKEETWVGS